MNVYCCLCFNVTYTLSANSRTFHILMNLSTIFLRVFLPFNFNWSKLISAFFQFSTISLFPTHGITCFSPNVHNRLQVLSIHWTSFFRSFLFNRALTFQSKLTLAMHAMSAFDFFFGDLVSEQLLHVTHGGAAAVCQNWKEFRIAKFTFDECACVWMCDNCWWHSNVPEYVRLSKSQL